MKLRQEKIDSYVNNVIKKDLPTSSVDEGGKMFIDETHAGWDVLPTPYGIIEMLGTDGFSERDIDLRIARLNYHYEREKLKKQNSSKKIGEIIE